MLQALAVWLQLRLCMLQLRLEGLVASLKGLLGLGECGDMFAESTQLVDLVE